MLIKTWNVDFELEALITEFVKLPYKPKASVNTHTVETFAFGHCSFLRAINVLPHIDFDEYTALLIMEGNKTIRIANHQPRRSDFAMERAPRGPYEEVTVAPMQLCILKSTCTHWVPATNKEILVAAFIELEPITDWDNAAFDAMASFRHKLKQGLTNVAEIKALETV